jgi:hypothetical protein
MDLPDSSEPPTPSVYAIIVVVLVGLLIGFGVVALVVAARAPAEKHQMALALEHCGFVFLGFGVMIGAIFWLVRRFTD